ncbi:MAG TPA: phospholipase domain-containing protein, partial [Rhizobacter sp.]|nr:phospholipase domain-containing protein [Rhizobacter sp.]
DAWNTVADGSRYDLWVCGPNGYVRHFKGQMPAGAVARPELSVRTQRHGQELELELVNNGTQPLELLVDESAYLHHGAEAPSHVLGHAHSMTVKPGHTWRREWHLAKTGGWYDLRLVAKGFERRLCGRVESGRASISDPAIARFGK